MAYTNTKKNQNPDIPQAQSFVAACSVLPSRVNSLKFQNTVLMLAANPRVSVVYIFYPTFCKRLNENYPIQPSWMSAHKVKVQNCEDVGPATKIVYALDLFDQDSPSTGIILFDDDRTYPATWFDDLMNAYEAFQGKHAVGRNGSLAKYSPFCFDSWNKGSREKQFFAMKTTFGVIYPRTALPVSKTAALETIAQYKDYDSECNDDMMLASWCHKSNTSIFLVPTSKQGIEEWTQLNLEEDDHDSLSKRSDHVRKQIQLASKMMQNGDFPTPWADVWSFVAVALVVLALFIFIICLIVH